MDWRLKCLALHAVSRAPPGLYAALQRRGSARYFLRLRESVFATFGYHVRNFRRVGGRALEFGAGRNLISALLLSNAGADEVLAYDVARLASVELVNRMIRELRARIPGDWPTVADLGEDLRRCYRIRYIAPGDVRRTGLGPGSVDFFCSTSTLEHIPAADIAAILAECRRVASGRALYSFVIDYHDHYCTADSRITRINFYRYSDFAWRFLNPPNHYQNRLRHSDYERLFASCGLDALESRAMVPEIDIDPAGMAARFRHYSRRDLMARSGFFALRAQPQGA